MGSGGGKEKGGCWNAGWNQEGGRVDCRDGGVGGGVEYRDGGAGEVLKYRVEGLWGGEVAGPEGMQGENWSLGCG